MTPWIRPKRPVPDAEFYFEKDLDGGFKVRYPYLENSTDLDNYVWFVGHNPNHWREIAAALNEMADDYGAGPE
jgi:hypothetical protein